MTIAEILRAKKAGKPITPEMANGFNDQADWALQVQEDLCPEIYAIELEQHLYEKPLPHRDWVTSGTVDLIGGKKDSPIPHIIDWKTGQERDYWAQVAIYGVAVMESMGTDEIFLTLAFVDQQRAFTLSFYHDELRKRVDALIESVRDPASPYSINAYCGYCNLRDLCPAWAAERGIVAGFFDKNLTLGERFAVLKSDPEKLSRFIVAFRRLKNQVEKVERLDQVALGMIQSGATMTGLTTITRKGNELVAPHKLKKLLEKLDAKELDSLLVADLKQAKELWTEKMGKTAFPSTETSLPTTYLALKR